ncbi:MAG: hypothetical protein U0X20_28220 [Caldilineaceae bacterium]
MISASAAPRRQNTLHRQLQTSVAWTASGEPAPPTTAALHAAPSAGDIIIGTGARAVAVGKDIQQSSSGANAQAIVQSSD